MSTVQMKNIESPQIVNWRVDDFCAAHGIGRTTLYSEIKAGRLKAVKLGKRTLIPDSEARAWQERLESGIEI